MGRCGVSHYIWQTGLDLIWENNRGVCKDRTSGEGIKGE